ncbi:MAG: PDZ domain-containing protein, partial [Clostridia bacterium]|nr:PDZ domain-containing protein [Clostridia bacterium]
IPSVTVKNIVDQLIGQGYVSGRPWLGISGESLSPFYQHYYLLPAGLYITSVESGSPADLAGILPRDILLALDGTPVTSQDDLERLLLDRQTGDTVVLTLYRAGQQGRVELTLAEDKG